MRYSAIEHRLQSRQPETVTPQVDAFFSDFAGFFAGMMQVLESMQQEFEAARNDPHVKIQTFERDLPGGGHIRGWSIYRRWGSSIPERPQFPLVPPVTIAPRRQHTEQFIPTSRPQFV